jgi:hypothetical protein
MSRLSRSGASECDSVTSSAKTTDGIHVSVRIRPLSGGELTSGIKSCCSATSKQSLVISKEGDTAAYLKSQAASDAEFAFDAVFDEHASQAEVYNRSAKPYLAKLILGENVTIFAYGATGAGNDMTLPNEDNMVHEILSQGMFPTFCRKDAHHVWKHQIRFYRCVCRSWCHSAIRSGSLSVDW